MKQKTIWI